MGKICFHLCEVDLTLIFRMDIVFVNGDASSKLHDDTIAETLWEGVPARRTEGQLISKDNSFHN